MHAQQHSYGCVGRDFSGLALASLLVSLVACEDAQPPTATRPPDQLGASAAEQATLSGVSAQNISLPVNQSVATTSPAPAFRITQTGTGPDGGFVISNSSNSQPALAVQTSGLGTAGRFQIVNSSSFAQAIYASTTGKGRAGAFQIFNSSSLAPALSATTNGTGPALSAQNTGLGKAGDLQVINSASTSPALSVASNGRGPALSVTNSGNGEGAEFRVTNSRSTKVALHAENDGAGAGVSVVISGLGVAGNFSIGNSANKQPAIAAFTQGAGWAGDFKGLGQGVRILTNSGVGLQVVGGSKQAVVSTPSGARSLYTEESSEVWFTDYGFGRLRNGRARILIDPAFAQTVNLDQPYQVFVQAYGDADLYVKERTALGFEVVFRAGNDRQAEFGYRIVAKRGGFESARLEPAEQGMEQ
jgi:hypothetical protein